MFVFIYCLEKLYEPTRKSFVLNFSSVQIQTKLDSNLDKEKTLILTSKYFLRQNYLPLLKYSYIYTNRTLFKYINSTRNRQNTRKLNDLLFIYIFRRNLKFTTMLIICTLFYVIIMANFTNTKPLYTEHLLVILSRSQLMFKNN